MSFKCDCFERCHLLTADIGSDLNAELSRVVSELECAIDEHRKLSATASQTDISASVAALNTSQDKSVQVRVYVCSNYRKK